MRRQTQRIYPGDGDPRHGTYNGYSNLLCWCEGCTEANRLEARRQWANRQPLAADDPRHGTTNGYGNFKCRCVQCTEAIRLASRRYRERSAEAAS